MTHSNLPTELIFDYEQARTIITNVSLGVTNSEVNETISNLIIQFRKAKKREDIKYPSVTSSDEESHNKKLSLLKNNLGTLDDALDKTLSDDEIRGQRQSILSKIEELEESGPTISDEAEQEYQELLKKADTNAFYLEDLEAAEEVLLAAQAGNDDAHSSS